MKGKRKALFGKDAKYPKELLDCSLFFKIYSFPVYWLVTVIIKIFLPPIFKLKIKNKINIKNLKKGIVIFNHCHYLDTLCVASAISPKPIYFSSTHKPFMVKGLRVLLKLLKVFPIPLNNPSAITPYIQKALTNNNFIALAPEGDLFDYNQNVFPLKKGAFYFAYTNSVPIIPIAVILNRRFFLKKEITRPFPKVTIIVGTPTIINDFGNTKEEVIEKSKLFFQKELQKYIDENNGDKSLYKGQIKHKI